MDHSKLYAGTWPARVAAILLGAFGLLPLASWIPGGPSADWFTAAAGELVSGTLIAIGGGVAIAILFRRQLMRLEPWVAKGDMQGPPPWRVIVATAGVAGATYAAIAGRVFSRKPLIIDEIVQAWQARVFASGHLWADTPARPEFTAVLNIVNDGAKTYAHFPPGGPAALALGELVGAQWLVGPFFGMLSVLLVGWLAREMEPRRRVALLAMLLFTFAPFTAFMAGSHMNHVPGLTFLLLGAAGTIAVLRQHHPRPGIALAAGLGFGLAATIRPLDAVAFALPAGVWYLIEARRDRARVADLLAAGIGVAVPITILLLVQDAMTGSPLRFGYEVEWGANVGLGFRGAPWGDAHTPLKGLELISLYVLRLQVYLFETPFPSLIPATIALAFVPGLSRADKYLLACAALLAGAYFAYWHDGFFLGPRFFYPLLPLLALWTARLPPVIRDRLGVGRAYWVAAAALVVGLLIAAAVSVPIRWRHYANSFTTSRWDADSAAAAAGVRNALVLVRESWGAQLIARMWALGLPKGEVEYLYRKVDACRLEQALARLEAMPPRNRPPVPGIIAALRPLTADSSRLVKSPWSADTTERTLPGSAYTPTCLQRISEDRRGFTLFPPLLLARGGGNVYVRDLGERNRPMLLEHPSRPLYLLRPDAATIGSPPRFILLRRDSLLAGAPGSTATPDVAPLR